MGVARRKQHRLAHADSEEERPLAEPDDDDSQASDEDAPGDQTVFQSIETWLRESLVMPLMVRCFIFGLGSGS